MPTLPARDAPARWLDESEIADSAKRLRRQIGVDAGECLDVGTILDWLTVNALPAKGKLELSEHLSDPKRYKAMVYYKPLRLNIERKTLLHGRLGQVECRFIICHEIGHMVLHDEYVKPYSIDPTSRKLFGAENTSAEWQADRFAEHFLVPDHILILYSQEHSLASACKVSSKVASRRLSQRPVLLQAAQPYGGDFCERCQNPTLIQRGWKCATCDDVKFL